MTGVCEGLKSEWREPRDFRQVFTSKTQIFSGWLFFSPFLPVFWGSLGQELFVNSVDVLRLALSLFILVIDKLDKRYNQQNFEGRHGDLQEKTPLVVATMTRGLLFWTSCKNTEFSVIWDFFNCTCFKWYLSSFSAYSFCLVGFWLLVEQTPIIALLSSSWLIP